MCDDDAVGAALLHLREQHALLLWDGAVVAEARRRRAVARRLIRGVGAASCCAAMACAAGLVSVTSAAVAAGSAAVLVAGDSLRGDGPSDAAAKAEGISDEDVDEARRVAVRVRRSGGHKCDVLATLSGLGYEAAWQLTSRVWDDAEVEQAAQQRREAAARVLDDDSGEEGADAGADNEDGFVDFVGRAAEEDDGFRRVVEESLRTAAFSAAEREAGVADLRRAVERCGGRLLDVIDVDGDGHCQFHALVRQLRLHGIELDYRMLRRMAADWLAPRGEELRCFVRNCGTAGEWDEYVARLRGGMDGDALTLLAVASRFNCEVKVWSTAPDAPVRSITPVDGAGLATFAVNLGHIHEWHYCSIEPAGQPQVEDADAPVRVRRSSRWSSVYTKLRRMFTRMHDGIPRVQDLAREFGMPVRLVEASLVAGEALSSGSDEEEGSYGPGEQLNYALEAYASSVARERLESTGAITVSELQQRAEVAFSLPEGMLQEKSPLFAE
eukprot:gene37956-62064_t